MGTLIVSTDFSNTHMGVADFPRYYDCCPQVYHCMNLVSTVMWCYEFAVAKVLVVYLRVILVVF